MSEAGPPGVAAMAESFDPYHVWLGIPPKDQPPNHYRLLAIEPFESDTRVIVAAAEQRMMHLRTYQLGKHVAWSQRLLNEVAGAKVCLLDPEEKAAYDERLRHEMQPTGPPPEPIGAAPAVAVERTPAQTDVSARRHSFLIGAGIFAALVVTGLVLWIASVRDMPVAGTPATVATAERKADEPKPVMPNPELVPKVESAAKTARPAKPELTTGPATAPTPNPQPTPKPSYAPPPKTEITAKPEAAAPKVEAAAKPAVSSNPQAKSRPKTDRSRTGTGIPNDWVTIVNRGTGKEIGKSQAMRIEPAGRFYKIRTRDGQFLTLADWVKQKSSGRHPLGFFQSVPDSKDPALLWNIKKLGDGFWVIANSTTGKCLEARENRNLIRDGVFRPGDPSQEWRFEPVKAP